MPAHSARHESLVRLPDPVEAGTVAAENALKLSVAALPSGTLTFMLTDVESSTRLWDAYPSEMAVALPQHEALVRAAIAEAGGLLVRRGLEGDSHFAVFTRATDAIACAVAIQLAHEREPWPIPEPLRVHLGIHTGQAQLRDGGYFGTTVNRCARLRALSRGGQILLSNATYDVVGESSEGWPLGVTPRALGEVRLEGLSRPDRVYQLVVEGLSTDFAPLATATASVPHNLSAELTSFVGRERELASLERLLLQIGVRLVTVTGPGGVGKTRLALRLANNLLGAFPDGVYHVGLTPVASPELVAPAVQHALGLLDRSERPALDALIEHLRSKRVLLVLDNFEQVVDAGPVVTELMRACPGVKALVTSRTVLRVTGEHIYELAPFALPPQDARLDDLRQHAAVRLFVDRARSARSAFAVSADGVRQIAEICRKLDGLPLAIELIAARARSVSIESLNSHLANQRLAFTVDGMRDAPARHQTLRAAIDWSFTLLTPVEQQVIVRLSAFATACTPEQADAVCRLPTEAWDVQAALTSLVDKSLLRLFEDADGAPRYGMLETIREYASEKLDTGPEATVIRRRHANVFSAFLEEVARQRNGPHEGEWLGRLGFEQENLRAAMAWAIAQHEVDLALHIADTSWWFLMTYGLTQEGVRLMGQVLELSEGWQTVLRARVLVGAGRLAFQGGDGARAEQHLQEALTIARATGDLELLNLALGGLSFVVFGRGDFARGVALAEENVEVASQTGDPALIGHAHVRLAEHLILNRDLARGLAESVLAVRLTAGLGDGSQAAALDTFGLAHRLNNQPLEAEPILERAVALHRQFGFKANLAEALFRLADVRIALDDANGAAEACREGLKAARASGSQRRVATGLRVAAALATRRGDLHRAQSLVAAALQVYSELAPTIIPVDLADVRAVHQSLLAASIDATDATDSPTLAYGSADEMACDEISILTAILAEGVKI